KAILIDYFRHSGVGTGALDAIVWLDGDLTFVGSSRADFEGVAAEMGRRNIEIAASQQGTIVGMLEALRRQGSPTAPFEQLLPANTVDAASPYYSTGVFLCRSPGFLERWSELSRNALDQPVIDQNVFNAIVHRGGHPVLPLDIDIWQAQGETLDRV